MTKTQNKVPGVYVDGLGTRLLVHIHSMAARALTAETGKLAIQTELRYLAVSLWGAQRAESALRAVYRDVAAQLPINQACVFDGNHADCDHS